MLSSVPYIETYRGFASSSRLIFKCRLLKEVNRIAGPEDSFWKNLSNSWKKTASNEISEAKVKIDLGDFQIEATSDKEGYIFLDLKAEFVQEENQRWNPIEISEKDESFTGEIMIPSCKATYGVISDIDDTILVTEVHSPLRMLFNSLIKNPYQRSGFENMDAFFNKLQQAGDNPVFYLSKSPWNLYKNIEQFLEINNMPKGPILLRDFGFHFPKVPSSYSDHKKENIELILSVYPNLPFILIGDASQADAIIYNSIKIKYPARIKEIYIREVEDEKKMKTLKSHTSIQKTNITFFQDYNELI